MQLFHQETWSSATEEGAHNSSSALGESSSATAKEPTGLAVLAWALPHAAVHHKFLLLLLVLQVGGSGPLCGRCLSHYNVSCIL